jgi:dipeptidyl aminopeptidase/acylaminoacyl peptidase
MFRKITPWLIVVVLLFTGFVTVREISNAELMKEIQKNDYLLKHRLDALDKRIDDVLWFNRVGDVAHIDKVFLASEPPRGHETATRLLDRNPVKIWSYIFIPKDIDPSKKYPLIVLPHGGVHGDFNTYYTHIIREMMAQQYIVVAPEYRGSTGYGRLTYERIDYGGLENADVDHCRAFMIENYSIVDPKRVGIVGWSHGGMIALMNIFENPGHYACAFAGVPVSDLVARMGYMRHDYESFFSADYHIGQPVHENIDEYRRRSPVFHAHKLRTPLLIHGNTNDEDVHVIEVENLVNALKAHDRKFEYQIFRDIPGGHSFDRMDHATGREIRYNIYKFLEKHLNPPAKFRNQQEMERAAYRFN